jgi:hypothetical protein
MNAPDLGQLLCEGTPQHVIHADRPQSRVTFCSRCNPPICFHRIRFITTSKPLMKKLCLFATIAALTVQLVTLHAQPGAPGGLGGMPGPRYSASLTKLFGDNPGFSATVENQIKQQSGSTMSIAGTIAFLEGKSRFEMDMTKAKGSGIPADAAEQMKAMGMDTMISITRPDKKLTYLIYPGLKAYAEIPLTDSGSDTPADKFKVEPTELGKETVEGHPCVKNKVVVTDGKDGKHEFVVWNATDLKNFPVKIEQKESGMEMTSIYKDIKFAKPVASLFDPPTGYTKYDNMMSMMQQEMMKRIGGGVPPGR